MIKIAHIINVVEDREGNPSFLNVAQPITIKSMVKAKKNAPSSCSVELFSVQIAREKQREMPREFNVLPPLIKDIADYCSFPGPVKSVPRIYDILLSLYLHSDAEWFIYTNVDIGVMPRFYNRIVEIINAGFDGSCINRRDIPKKYKGVICSVDTLDEIYKLPGQHHGGKDCFLFRRDVFPKYNFSNMAIGYPPIGTQIRDEVKRHSKKFSWIRNGTTDQQTFHIGKDEEWRKGSQWDQGNLKSPQRNGILESNLKEQRFVNNHYGQGSKSKYNQFELEGNIPPGRELNPRWSKLREKYRYGSSVR